MAPVTTTMTAPASAAVAPGPTPSSIAELDLRAAYNPNTLADKISAVPGLKTSTAFFTFLRANLVLPQAVAASDVSTPTLEPYLHPSPHALLHNPFFTPVAATAHPSVAAAASRPSTSSSSSASSLFSAATLSSAPGTSSSSALSAPVRTSTGRAAGHPPGRDGGIPPPLSLVVLTSPDHKAAALRLVADSIAQQRGVASLHLALHPLLLAALAALLFATRRAAPDLATWAMLAAGCATGYLLAVRLAAAGYLRHAEAPLRRPWLHPGPAGAPGPEDVVIAARVAGGDAIVGALVLRLEPLAYYHAGGGGGSGHSHNHSHSSTASGGGGGGGMNSGGGGGGGGRRRNNGHSRTASLKGGRGVIRAWTTRRAWRGKGVGVDMLFEAVRATKERCGRDAEVGFAREHANSAEVLPEFFNGPFRRRERRATRALQAVVAEWEGGKRRR